FFEHKLLYKENMSTVPEENYAIPLGVADVKRTGTDMTIIATGIMVSRALEAAEELEKWNVSAEVIDPRTLVPLDEASLLQSVRKTGRVMVVHEAVKKSGFGAEIASLIAEEAFYQLKAPIKRLGGEFVPIPSNKKLAMRAVPQTTDILQAGRELIGLETRTTSSP